MRSTVNAEGSRRLDAFEVVLRFHAGDVQRDHVLRRVSAPSSDPTAPETIDAVLRVFDYVHRDEVAVALGRFKHGRGAYDL